MPDAVTREPMRALVVVRDPVERALVSWVLDHDDRFAPVVSCGDPAEVPALSVAVDVIVVDLALVTLGAGRPLGGAEPRGRGTPHIVVISYVDAPYLRAAVAREGVVWLQPAGPDDLCDGVAAAASAPDVGLRPWCP